MKTIKILLSFIIMVSIVTMYSCKEDEPAALTVVSITGAGTDLETGSSTTVDLNAAQSATGVPLDVVITVSFSANVDETTATSNNIFISADGNTISSTITVSGTDVTIDPDSELGRGADHTLTLSGNIRSAEGAGLSEVARVFKSAGRPEVVAPEEENMTFYMTFDGELADETENYEIGNSQLTGFEEDRFGFTESVGHFDGNGDIIDIANSASILTQSMTVSFWMKVDAADTNKVNHNFGIIGNAAERGFFIEMGGSAESTWIKPPTRHVNSDGGSGTGWSDAINGAGDTNDVVLVAYEGSVSNLIDDQWVQFVMTYDHTTSIKTCYINGVVVRQEDFTNQNPSLLEMSFDDTGVESTIDMNLGIGFYGSSTNAATSWADYNAEGGNHPRSFSGLMDDLRIWSVALTDAQVTQLYDDEK